MSVPYKLWHVQREDLYHARHVASALPSVDTHHDIAADKQHVDQKKIMLQKMQAEALDKDNYLLLERLKKIHTRTNNGWNKSHLFERLGPQFERQLAQVRDNQQNALRTKNNYDQRRLRSVKAHVKHGRGEDSPSYRIPQRPSGLKKSRRLKKKSRRKLQQHSDTVAAAMATAGSGTDPSSAGASARPESNPVQSTPTSTRAIDTTVWKLCYRAGTRLDMLNPSNDDQRLPTRSQPCVISMWRLRNGASTAPHRLLVVCEDVQTLSKKLLLLRAHHLKYMMTMQAPKLEKQTTTTSSKVGSPRKRRQLDSRGWDHAVQIPMDAKESFDALQYHLNQHVPPPPKVGPLRPPSPTPKDNATYYNMWHQLIVNSLVISSDLALSVQHPLTSLLSKKQHNTTILTTLIERQTQQEMTPVALAAAKAARAAASLTSKKDPRDLVDANCTFSPKLIKKPLRRQRNAYEIRAAETLERSRQIVLETGHQYMHMATTSEKLAKEQEKRRNLRIVQQVQEEALLTTTVDRHSNRRRRRRQVKHPKRTRHKNHNGMGGTQAKELEELHEGASKIQSIYRRRQASKWWVW
mgnify:FL=1